MIIKDFYNVWNNPSYRNNSQELQLKLNKKN